MKDQLALVGERLHALLRTLPDHDAITDTLDYLIGAVYGLECALECGFRARPGTWDRPYRAFLTKYILDITAGREVHHLWLGGFHFNSAIQRLAASYDRIPLLLGARGKNAHERMVKVGGAEGGHWYWVYKEVNAFKHSPMGKARGRRVTLKIALDAVDEALHVVEQSTEQLARRYTTGRT